ncbi:Hemicentin-2 [Stylophora pistillata]|uniref:Hemicentin-2 n=1 Tax=Stylophora pistillata TaxID=50429 RepID=A0A2B4RYS8_STYPI|nr:Hemicentin-2 [Stylophora pistillata]
MFLVFDEGTKAFDQSGTILYQFGKEGNQVGQFNWPCGLLIDCGSITWYEPLPVTTVLSAGDYPTPGEKKLFEGHPASLSWNFSFTSVTLFAVAIKFNTDTVAFSGPEGQAAAVEDAFKDRFNFSWISQRLTLVIFNATAEYDESNGAFRCELTTSGGTWIRRILLKILDKSDGVSLKTNATRNNGCVDIWVTFTCSLSDSNLAVHNYMLVKNGTEVSLSESGTWIERISRGETFVYKCVAYQQVDNVTSKNNVTLTVKVPVDVEEMRNVTVMEGTHVTKECNVTAGTPPLTVLWENVKSDQIIEGKLLNISSITRYQREYRCIANNSCGSNSSTMFIDVQYKPDNVTLETNTTEYNGCVDVWVTFTCNSSEANPPVHNYMLLKNGTGVGFSESGKWLEKISRGDTFVYNCVAYQKLDNVTSSNSVTMTVEVPVNLEQIQNVTVMEGMAVTRECNVTAGTHPLTVLWENVKSGQIIEGKLLNISNITRYQREYRCIANNSCGSNSTTMVIDVQYKPDTVTLKTNTTNNNSCVDVWVTFACNSSEANPPLHNYMLLKNGTEVSFSENGIWMQKISRGETFLYNCVAYQRVDNVTSTNSVTMTVKVPVGVEQIQKVTVVEGTHVTKECNVTAGTPPLTVLWENVKSGHSIEGKLLNISNITRYQREYRCIANNTCGSNSTTMVIDVQYKPDNVTLVTNATKNNDCVDIWVTFTCNSSEANPPVYSYMLLKNGTEVSFSKSRTWLEKISRGETFVYNCVAYQQVENVTSTNSVTISVKVPVVVEQLREVIVMEGTYVTKKCNVTAGTPPLSVLWKNVKSGQINDGKLLNISNITRYQREYRCIANNSCGSNSTTMFFDVQYKPDNVTLETNATENNGCVDIWVTFTCNSSEANPPVHNYMLLKNGTEVSFSESGTWLEKISRGETFVYNCVAYQKVDNVTSTNSLTITVKVPVGVEQIKKVTVVEGTHVTKECNVTAGSPPLTVLWENVKRSQIIEGTLLNISNITRYQREYRCIANNSCGSNFTTMVIDVQYKPDNVTLETNATENNGCVDIWVTFTCNSSGANPPVHNYMLFKNGPEVSFSENGRWMQKISPGETFVYNCVAYQQVDNVTSTNSVTLTVKVPVDMEHIRKLTVMESAHVTKECNVTAGTLPLTVLWENVKSGQIIDGKLLNISNITRYQREYRCIANNSCGSNSTTMVIDVQYKPDNVTLETNTTKNHYCVDIWVAFSCNSSEANPPVHNYMLLKNGTEVSLSESGTWLEKISRGETFVYKCVAYQQVDNVTSTNSVIITVKVPVDVEQIRNVTVTEGTVVTKECNVTAGTTPLTLFWENVQGGQIIEGKLLNISNITRYQREYRCIANNTCGSNSTTMLIDVQFKPDNVTLKTNTTENNGCIDIWVTFTCYSSEANPPVHNYMVLKNGTEVSFSENGIWMQKISRGEKFVYNCVAYQEVDNVTSTNSVTMTVKVPVDVEQIRKVTVMEGTHVTKECNVTAGTPPLTVLWENVKSGHIIEGKLLNISNITRYQREYRCIANNSCGSNSTTMVIDVQYKPDNVTLETNTTKNNYCVDIWVIFTCNSTEANPPVHNYLLFKNGSEVSLSESGTWLEKISRGDTFVYNCVAYQQVENVTSTNSVTITVKVPVDVEQIRKVTVMEGTYVTKECKVTAGTPPLSVRWENVKRGQIIEGELLNISKITRYQREYRCIANNTCGSNSTSMFIDVQYKPGNVTLETNATWKNSCVDIWVTFTCNSSEANPPVHNYMLLKNGTEVGFSEIGTWLEKISRDKTFIYSCVAFQLVDNMTSTNSVTVARVKPDNVTLETNTTENNGCVDVWVTFTCNSSEANPPVHNYMLLKNGTEVGFSEIGTWLEKISRDKTFIYSCVAFQLVDNMTSTNSVTVARVPVTVEQIQSLTVIEGTNVTRECNATGGSPPPAVFWENVKSGRFMAGRLLNITHITRFQTEYRCIANNICGMDSTTMFIDVQYKPSSTQSSSIVKLVLGEDRSIGCPVDIGNPPAVITWFKGNDTNGTKIAITSTLEVQSAVLSDEGWYICFAKNVLGNATGNLLLLVVLPTAATPSPTTPTVKGRGSSLASEITEVYLTVTIQENCSKRSEVAARFPDVACQVALSFGCLSANSIYTRCGSVVLDFMMKLNQSVVVSHVLTFLSDAARKDKFGVFKVDPASIKQVLIPTDGLDSPTQGPEESNCPCNDVLLKAIIGVLVFIIFLPLVYIVWLYRKGALGKQGTYEDVKGVYDKSVEGHGKAAQGIEKWDLNREVEKFEIKRRDYKQLLEQDFESRRKQEEDAEREKKDWEDCKRRRRAQAASVLACGVNIGERLVGGEIMFRDLITRLAGGAVVVTTWMVLRKSNSLEEFVNAFNEAVLPFGNFLRAISEGSSRLTIQAENVSDLDALWQSYQDETPQTNIQDFLVTEEIKKVRVEEYLENLQETYSEITLPSDSGTGTRSSAPSEYGLDKESTLTSSSSAKAIMQQLESSLQIDLGFFRNPTPEDETVIRILARKAKKLKRMDVFYHLRKITPPGATGPRLPNDLHIEEVPKSKKDHLSNFLQTQGGMPWDLARKLHLRPSDVNNLRKGTNILDVIVMRHDLRTVGELYDFLCDHGQPRAADKL